MTVLMAGQLYPRLERLRAVWTRVGAFLAVRQQVMIVDGGCLEAFTAVLTGIRPYACMRAHVKGQAVGHAKGLATNLSTKIKIASVMKQMRKPGFTDCTTSTGNFDLLRIQ